MTIADEQAGCMVSQLVARWGGALHGVDVWVRGVAALEAGGAEHIGFAMGSGVRSVLAGTHCAVVITTASEQSFVPGTAWVVEQPQVVFAQVAALLHGRRRPALGVSPLAVLGGGVHLGPDCSIGPFVHLGDGVRLGARVVIESGCVLEDAVQIGDDAWLHPNVTIHHDCVLGARVRVHSAAVIGADGFGNAWDGQRWIKIPQLGRVTVGDDVEIGASTTIDRGALGDTVIEDGVRLDNQIQIGHNCRVGRHTAMAGCVGVAGSAHIGRYCTFGGGAMILGHLRIVDHVNVMAGTLVGKSLLRAGTYVGQYPVQLHADWKKNAAHLRRLDYWVRSGRGDQPKPMQPTEQDEP